MNNQIIGTVRWLATVAVIVLTSMYSYYPAYHWIPVTLGALSMLGIHVVPASKLGNGNGNGNGNGAKPTGSG